MISGSPVKLGALTTGLLVMLLGVGCSPSQDVSEPQAASETLTASVSAPTAVPPAASPSPAPVDFFQKGLEKANSAATIAQSAQSRDDWTLVANRWQQAIDLMAAVPTNSANRQKAQGKLIEYRRNLTVARQRANQPVRQAAAPQPSVILVEPSPSAAPANQSTSTVAAAQAPATDGPRVFSAPIVRREGGTPVIRVVFNGSQPFDMIVDTGASGTLITQQMAAALNVVPAGQAQVDTASSQSVTFPLGYVRSIQVDQVVARNVLVAVAGSGLQTGLLGHDFFGNYDVTIRQDRVEFSER